MSSHDQAAETLRDFVSTQVRKIFRNTRDEALECTPDTGQGSKQVLGVK
jgi:hypothetical protein